MQNALLVAVAIAADLSATHGAPLPARPERVFVEGNHAGWHSRHQTLIIGRNDRRFSDGVREIDERLLNDIVASTTAPPISSIERDRLGIDAEQLRTWAENHATRMYPRELVDGVVERFLDPNNLANLVDVLGGGGWTDDSPSVRVEITLRGGDKIVATSTRQPPLMLPWHVEYQGRAWQTFNPAISRAVAAVLPPGFVERDRLSGEDLEAYLADAGIHRGARKVDLNAPYFQPPDLTVAPSSAQRQLSPRMFEDGTLKFQATLKNNSTEPITIDLTEGSLSADVACNRKRVFPAETQVAQPTARSSVQILKGGESSSFVIPVIFTYANSARTRVLLYSPVAGQCRVTFSMWFKRGNASADRAGRVESNAVTLDLSEPSRATGPILQPPK